MTEDKTDVKDVDKCIYKTRKRDKHTSKDRMV